MEIQMTIDQTTKNELKLLLDLISKDEYRVMTNDRGETYMFVHQGTKKATYCLTWLELCINYIPKRLGINYMIIPMNDGFNVARYLIDYYNDLSSNANKEISYPEEETTDNPYALDGSH